MVVDITNYIFWPAEQLATAYTPYSGVCQEASQVPSSAGSRTGKNFVRNYNVMKNISMSRRYWGRNLTVRLPGTQTALTWTYCHAAGVYVYLMPSSKALLLQMATPSVSAVRTTKGPHDVFTIKHWHFTEMAHVQLAHIELSIPVSVHPFVVLLHLTVTIC
jgi:hypothetical protein